MQDLQRAIENYLAGKASREEQQLVKGGRQKVTVVAPHQLLLIAEGRTQKS